MNILIHEEIFIKIFYDSSCIFADFVDVVVNYVHKMY